MFLFLLPFHHLRRIDIRRLMYLPIERAKGDGAHQQQGDEEDADAYGRFHYKVLRIDVDNVAGNGYGNDESDAEPHHVFAEKELVKVFHARTIYLADSNLAITLADVKQGDAEQSQAGYGNGYQGKDGVDGGD